MLALFDMKSIIQIHWMWLWRSHWVKWSEEFTGSALQSKVRFGLCDRNGYCKKPYNSDGFLQYGWDKSSVFLFVHKSKNQ